MNDTKLAFPVGSMPHETLRATAEQARVAVICGIPAMGKSLFLCELALLAEQRGRLVHCLQWDIALLSFNLPQIIAAYPDMAGVTHPVIRRAAGLWVRAAVADWRSKHPDREHFLIIEAPLVGGRFIELARRADDAAEAFLASDLAHFLIPQPTAAVRTAIQSARTANAARPRHTLDEKNARPAVVDALWDEIVEVANTLHLRHDSADSSYSPASYLDVYARLLKHRQFAPVRVEHILEGTAPYAHQGKTVELAPTASEALRLIAAAETLGIDEAVRFAQQWYRY